jgi:hypothetical protein
MSVTVAEALALVAVTGEQNAGFQIVDNAADVSQNVNALEGLITLGDVGSITLTDPAPVLTVTSAELTPAFNALVYPLISDPVHIGLSVDLSGPTLTYTLPPNVSSITLTGSGNAVLSGNALNVVYDIDAQGNVTINPGDLGDCTIEGKAGTTTLDYSSLFGALTVDVNNGTVAKPGGLWTDTFTGAGVQVFDGASGPNTFEGIGTGDYTFNGNGNDNTLNYSADANGVTISLVSDTVVKDFIVIPQHPVVDWQDSFSDIQNFVGGSGGSNTFQSVTNGDFTFTGQGGGNTLDYSAAYEPVTINLTNDTVEKGVGFNDATFPPTLVSWQDSFSDIQNFIGATIGATTFQSITNGDFTFTGQGGGNTLDYSAADEPVIINLTNDTVVKVAVPEPPNFQGVFVDSFSDIQNFVGSPGASTIIDGPGSHSFTGGNGVNIAEFHGPLSEYTIAASLGSDGLMHTDVTDNGGAGDGPLDLVNVQQFQFADQTVSVPPMAFLNGQGLTTPEEQVEAMYVAYFGRAGDVAGTGYWTTNLETGQTIDDVAMNFSKQVESENLYPFLASPTTASASDIDNFIESIYQNLFDRQADASGLAYWSGAQGLGGYQTALKAGTITPLQFQTDVGDFILTVIGGAQNSSAGQDITTFQNKVTVASYFTDQLAIQNVPYANNQPAEVDAQAHAVVTGTNSNQATVTAEETVALAGITNDPHAM